jgi:hypothetical protein
MPKLRITMGKLSVAVSVALDAQEWREQGYISEGTRYLMARVSYWSKPNHQDRAYIVASKQDE